MIVRLSGSPRAQGLQHAAAMPAAARRRLAALVARHRPGAAAAALLDVARRETPETVAVVEGLAAGLGIPFPRLWAYTVRGYVSELGRDGCGRDESRMCTISDNSRYSHWLSHFTTAKGTSPCRVGQAAARTGRAGGD